MQFALRAITIENDSEVHAWTPDEGQAGSAPCRPARSSLPLFPGLRYKTNRRRTGSWGKNQQSNLVEDIEREDDKQRERTILATCAPFIQQARRRFDEGAGVTTVARDLGAPLQSVSDVFVLHQLWASQNTKPAASFEGTKAALVFGRSLRGVDDATVERELGLAPEEVRRLRDQYDELASLPPFDPDMERPHRFGDVYTWLTVQKQQGEATCCSWTAPRGRPARRCASRSRRTRQTTSTSPTGRRPL